MATRGSNGKAGGPRKAGAGRTPARKSGQPTGARAGGKRTREPEAVISPEHQRELFALGLITVALVTLIFFATGEYGGFGGYYVSAVRQAFGDGAIVVPVTLGLIGVAILIQERFRDTRLTVANLIGTLFTLGAMLALLELPHHDEPLDLRTGGGGLIGYALVTLLDGGIGRPAATLVVLILGLAGVILTFNITLRELLTGIGAGLLRFWATVWGAPRLPAERAAPQRQAPDALPFIPPPLGADDDLIPTPIAERPARASLFKREAKAEAPRLPEPAQAAPKAPPPRPVETPKPARGEAPKPVVTPARPPAPVAPDPPGALVQESLDGFDVSSVQRTWPLPPVELLEHSSSDGRMLDEEIRRLSRTIEDTLASFKVEAQVVNVNPGPAVTQFEVQPAVGVKVSKITSLEKDLALSLAASSIRIEAPIPGKSAVGIEIPNSSISIVGIREVMDCEEFEQSRGKLKLPLGKDVSGTPIIADMARMPHLLVAGATGSGKSVAVNAFLCGLLLKHSPDDLKLILVDPKMVEMIVYNHIPHLLSPVVTELERVVPTLKWATREMERRYKVFARYACRNLDSYRQLARRRPELEAMPYILIVIDELADLMMMAPDETETYICRLAQMARATGIHLILATQRPSVDVITGLIKANFPSRIAFAVTSQIDSRVILDGPGAESLLGRGDMLYMAADAAKLVRIQGTYVSDREVEAIVGFWRNAKPPEPSDAPPVPGAPAAAQGPQPPPAPGQSPPPAPAAPPEEAFAPPAQFLSAGEQDELLPQAISLVKQHQRASASLLQRRLRIGYSKAAQLIDLLEQQGVVGPADGGRSREVLSRDPDAAPGED